MNKYVKQAKDFLKETNSTLKIKYYDYGTMPNWNDKEKRDIYKCTLKRDNKQFTITFRNSVFNTQNGIVPNEYDVLACLQKYEVGNFENFCSEFGYSDDSISALKTYKACKKEYENLLRLYNENELEKAREIQ
jgi:hypothetical protein